MDSRQTPPDEGCRVLCTTQIQLRRVIGVRSPPFFAKECPPLPQGGPGPTITRCRCTLAFALQCNILESSFSDGASGHSTGRSSRRRRSSPLRPGSFLPLGAGDRVPWVVFEGLLDVYFLFQGSMRHVQRCRRRGGMVVAAEELIAEEVVQDAGVAAGW